MLIPAFSCLLQQVTEPKQLPTDDFSALTGLVVRWPGELSTSAKQDKQELFSEMLWDPARW